MKFFQLILENNNAALIKTREFRQVLKHESESDIIMRSWNKFKTLDADDLMTNEGYDKSNIDDFIEWHNFRNKINIVRFNVEDINLD